MSRTVKLSSEAVESIAASYQNPYEALQTDLDLRELGRDVRRTVIRKGGQGDCASVSAALSSVLDELSVPHQTIPMEQGQYDDKNDNAPHAWVIIGKGGVPAAHADIILDATAEQFWDNQTDVHVLSVDDSFARAHYKTPLHDALRPS